MRLTLGHHLVPIIELSRSECASEFLHHTGYWSSAQRSRQVARHALRNQVQRKALEEAEPNNLAVGLFLAPGRGWPVNVTEMRLGDALKENELLAIDIADHFLALQAGLAG